MRIRIATPLLKATVGSLSVIFLSICLLTSTSYAQDQHRLKGPRVVDPGATAGKRHSVSGARVNCQSGFANEYPCNSADMLAQVDVQDLLGGLDTASSETNDVWGWTDAETGKEYVLVGMNGGVSFVEIADPINPIVLGFLPTPTRTAIWRDIKVYSDHAFVVADNAGSHGMQVFDLTQLRNVANPPQLFEETTNYSNINSAHNIVINEDTGFAYIVGGSGGGETCGGGIHMVNIQDPTSPTFAGCSDTGYTHDAQCVVYNGPDTDHQGKEICVESSVKDIVITDVSDKANPSVIGSGSYPTIEYAHQGWLTEDHRYFFQDDELDESRRGNSTKTIVWDFIDLDDPVVLTEYEAATPNIDHNLYVRDGFMFQSNYTAGLRILDVNDPANPVEIAFFDTFPANNNLGFSGTWSNYPFFESEVIAVTSDFRGLFLIESNAVSINNEESELPTDMTLSVPYPNPFDGQTSLTLTVDKAQQMDVSVYDMLGRQVATLYSGVVPANTPQVVTFDGQDLPHGKYIIRASGESSALSRVVTLIR